MATLAFTDAELSDLAARLKPYLGTTTTPPVQPPVTPVPPPPPSASLPPGPTVGWDGFTGGLEYISISSLNAEDACFFLDTKDAYLPTYKGFNWKPLLVGSANEVMNWVQLGQQYGRARYRQDLYIARPGTLAKVWAKYKS